jgi:3-phosphoshikimate 1-carboxyvinyltransferase
MIEINPGIIKKAIVTVPGSKSYTHRMLIAAALSDGPCIVLNPLKSEDTLITSDCLSRLGITIRDTDTGFTIEGTSGRLQGCEKPIDLGNSGTSMRLLTAVAALADGSVTLTGTRRMRERPIKDLLDGLTQMGVPARCLNDDGCPPVVISIGRLNGGKIDLDCRISSQFLSALLLISPFARQKVEIAVSHGLVSKPYVDITLEVMEQFGVSADRIGYDQFTVPAEQTYKRGTYEVEPDCSQAGYFWAAAAIARTDIKVIGTSLTSRQGDVRITECLKNMGCTVVQESDGIRVVGGQLKGITVDMADLPDMVPTLAVVAAFAQGTTIIENVAHLRAKESDRLSAVAKELSKMDVDVECGSDDLKIVGGRPRAAMIDTYDDHRIAMSFALAGLKVPGVKIKNETCVRKSFPNFWTVFNGLYDKASFISD